MDVEGATAEPVVQEPAEPPHAELDDLAQLADALVEEIAAARSHYDELRAALEAEDPTALDGAHWGTLAEDGTEPIAVAYDGELATEEAQTPSLLEEARLSALRLALTGGTREDACRHLREWYDIEAPEGIVDEAFGTPIDGVMPGVRKRRFARLRRTR